MFRQVHSHCFEVSERQFRPIQNLSQFASEVSVLTNPFEGEHMCRIGSFRIGCGVPNLHRSLSILSNRSSGAKPSNSSANFSN